MEFDKEKILKETHVLKVFIDLDHKYKNLKVGSIIKFLLFEKLFSIREINKLECEVLLNLAWIKHWHIN